MPRVSCQGDDEYISLSKDGRRSRCRSRRPWPLLWEGRLHHYFSLTMISTMVECVC